MNLLALNFTYEQILPLILALLLIFILPMIMRRYGLTAEDLTRMILTRFGKQDYGTEAQKLREQKTDRREPYASNGRSGDLKSLVSTLLLFVRRHQLGLVYPGTVTDAQGNTAGLLALLVTRSEVIGFNCFGYGGTITEGKNGGDWNQHMNGGDQPFASPLKGNAQQREILRRVMDADGMQTIPVRVVAVFTSRTLTLETKHPREVFSVDGLIQYLKEQTAQEEDRIDPSAIARQLNGHVTRIRPGKR